MLGCIADKHFLLTTVNHSLSAYNSGVFIIHGFKVISWHITITTIPNYNIRKIFCVYLISLGLYFFSVGNTSLFTPFPGDSSENAPVLFFSYEWSAHLPYFSKTAGKEFERPYLFFFTAAIFIMHRDLTTYCPLTVHLLLVGGKSRYCDILGHTAGTVRNHCFHLAQRIEMLGLGPLWASQIPRDCCAITWQGKQWLWIESIHDIIV